jgi:hypothetical protein
MEPPSTTMTAPEAARSRTAARRSTHSRTYVRNIPRLAIVRRYPAAHELVSVEPGLSPLLRPQSSISEPSVIVRLRGRAK